MTMRRYLLLTILTISLCLPLSTSPVYSQTGTLTVTPPGSSTPVNIGTSILVDLHATPQLLTIAALPTADGTNGLRIVTDSDNDGCTVGGGSVLALCLDIGSGWQHIGGTDDQIAAEVPFTPTGGISATDVQAALAEVDSEHTVDTDDQTAAEVSYTPTTGTDWVDPDPTDAGTGLDDLASRLTTEEAKADDDVPESGDFGAAVDLEADGSLSVDTVGLDQLNPCLGPDEVVQYGASGIPSCIATPTGVTDHGLLDAGSLLDDDHTQYALLAGRSGGQVLIGGTGANESLRLMATSNSTAGDVIVRSNDTVTSTLKVVAVGAGANSFLKIDKPSGQYGGFEMLTNNVRQLYFNSNPDNTMHIGNDSLGDFVVFNPSGVTLAEPLVVSEDLDLPPSSVTCTDSGDASPSTLTITPTTSTIEITNSDADGCAVDVSETGPPAAGRLIRLYVVSSAGGTVDLADVAGQQNVPGASVSLGLDDMLCLQYSSTRSAWLGCGVSDN